MSAIQSSERALYSTGRVKADDLDVPGTSVGHTVSLKRITPLALPPAFTSSNLLQCS
jgi:hypothetical protein